MGFRVAAVKANFRRMFLIPPPTSATFRNEPARKKLEGAAGFTSVKLNKSVPLFAQAVKEQPFLAQILKLLK
jgi:hypothetical protein